MQLNEIFHKWSNFGINYYPPLESLRNSWLFSFTCHNFVFLRKIGKIQTKKINTGTYQTLFISIRYHIANISLIHYFEIANIV